jgi:hypothetical protein
MNRSMRVSLASLALPIILAFSSCGDGLDLTPNLSGPAGPAGGGNNATPTPAPTATPAATPAATPTATPTQGLTCGLSSRPDCGASCCSAGGSNDFVGIINDAQAALERSNPEIFNSNGSLRIGEIEYTNRLAAKITSMSGVCAIGGGNGSSRSKDEVGLKRDNDRSINVDVIIGGSETPYIGGVYTCRPAAF